MGAIIVCVIIDHVRIYGEPTNAREDTGYDRQQEGDDVNDARCIL